MLSNSQKEHLTYTAVGQIVTLFAMFMVAYQYIFPGISSLNTEARTAQEAIISYQSTLTGGIPESSLQLLLSNKAERAELVKVIQTDPKGAQAIIKKPNGIERNYLDWLKSEIGKTDDEKRDLINEKAKLNSIIPTMSPFSNNIEENNITLREYVNYIEKTILKRFNFDSNVVIGMQGITFGGGKGIDVPESVGMFEFRLDFKGTNDDILKFIDYINNSGKPDILSFTGILGNNDIPDAMSNPLITMESFSIQEYLDQDNPTKENTGRATLRFYIRGVSKEDLKFLSENLKMRQTELETRITESVAACEKDGVICASYNKKLLAFQRKYKEYTRTLEQTPMPNGGSDQIYILTQSANTLKTLEEELNSIVPKPKNQ